MLRKLVILKNNEDVQETMENFVKKCEFVFSKHKLLVFIMCLMIIALILGLSFGFWEPVLPKTKVIEKSTNGFRLPRSISPHHYVWEIQPYLEPGNFRFEGKVEIVFECIEETDSVILHSSGLSIGVNNVTLRSVNDTINYSILDITFNHSTEFVILKLSDRLISGNEYKLFINYNGKLNNSGSGIFYSTYEDSQFITKYVASTQFQPTFARQALPCFDEPEMKATFDITVVRWRNMTSLSNMRKLKTESRGNLWEADIYETSMKMPTELVAFVVGEFVGKTKGRITFWSTNEEITHTTHALNLSSRLLTFYEKLLGVKYGAPKLDMVVLSLRGLEGMENWGLITLAKSILRHGANYVQSVEARKSTVRVIAHEIAHQWFGNLVTPRWWSDIWLSEGISSYLEHIASAEIFPEYNEISKTVQLASTKSFKKDCFTASTSTVWKIATGRISFTFDNTFDGFTYDKGAIITRMIHYILGNETFWRLLTKYLKENAYGNVDENDFWRHMTEYPGVDMSEVMPSWTHISGVPIVSVERSYLEGTVKFSQTSCKAKKYGEHESDLWNIPISFSSSNNPSWNPPITSWMDDRNITIGLGLPLQEWILVNGQSVGNYIVHYDRRNWKLLARQLKRDHEVFSAEQRYKLLADANNLRDLGYTDMTADILLDLSSYLQTERSLPVFSPPALDFIYECLLLMKQTPYDEKWKDFIFGIFGPLYDRMAWKSDYDRSGHEIKILHQAVIYWLCDLNYEPCVNDALEKFHVWHKNGAERADLTSFTLPLMLCAVSSFEEEGYSGYLYELYRRDDDIDLLFPLGCSSKAAIINEVLKRLLKVDDSNFILLGKVLTRNNKHWIMLFEFVDDHFNDIAKELKLFKRILRLFGIFNNNVERSEKVLEIMKKNIITLSGWRNKKSMDLIRRQEKLIPKLKSKKQMINTWLSQRSTHSSPEELLR